MNPNATTLWWHFLPDILILTDRELCLTGFFVTSDTLVYTFAKHLCKGHESKGILPNTVARPACNTCLPSTWVTVRHSCMTLLKGSWGAPLRTSLDGYSRDFYALVYFPKTCDKWICRTVAQRCSVTLLCNSDTLLLTKKCALRTPAPCPIRHYTLHHAAIHTTCCTPTLHSMPHTTPLKIVCFACQSEAQLIWKTNTVTRLLCSDETPSGMAASGHMCPSSCKRTINFARSVAN